jgi:hypothetical protein
MGSMFWIGFGWSEIFSMDGQTSSEMGLKKDAPYSYGIPALLAQVQLYSTFTPILLHQGNE